MTVHIHAAVAGAAAVLAAALLARAAAPGGRYAQAALAGFVALIGLEAGVTVLENAAPAAAPWLPGASYPLLLLQPAALWLYLRLLTEPEPRLAPRDLWHAAPAAAGAVLMVPFYALEDDAKLALAATAPNGLYAALLGVMGVAALWMALLTAYGVAALRRLGAHRARLRGLYAGRNSSELRWLDATIGFVLVAAGATALDGLLVVLLGRTILPGAADPAFGGLLLLFLAVFALGQGPVLPRWSAGLELRGRHARSPLAEEDLRRILGRLDAAMRERALWRRPLLSLRDLSEAAGAPLNHVSEALNAGAGRNFYDYVNGLRIDEARRLLLETDETVLDVAVAVGFNAKSTFNAAFRKHAGTTPSAFRRAARAAGPSGRANGSVRSIGTPRAEIRGASQPVEDPPCSDPSPRSSP
jgi:AraC-like DNA-binding protein